MEGWILNATPPHCSVRAGGQFIEANRFGQRQKGVGASFQQGYVSGLCRAVTGHHQGGIGCILVPVADNLKETLGRALYIKQNEAVAFNWLRGCFGIEKSLVDLATLARNCGPKQCVSIRVFVKD